MSLTWKPNDGGGVGTSLRGKIPVSFDRLVEVFGEPNELNAEPSGDDKVHNEWCITFEVGNVLEDEWDLVDVTIYDWKEPHAHVSRYGKYLWHIGAKNSLGVECVYDALEIV